MLNPITQRYTNTIQHKNNYIFPIADLIMYQDLLHETLLNWPD